jgi:hypothetical protein
MKNKCISCEKKRVRGKWVQLRKIEVLGMLVAPAQKVWFCSKCLETIKEREDI